MKRIVRFFTENWALKLIALVLAVLLWLAVQSNRQQRATFGDIPVHVDLRDPDWRMAGPPSPRAISVTVSGPRSELISLANSPPTIVLPIERVNDTVETQVIPAQWVRIPERLRDVRILGLRPDTVRLHYQRLASRTLPVQVKLKGRLPAGLRLVQPVHTNPAVVRVLGVRSQVMALDSVPLFPVDVSKLRSNINVPASVDTTVLRGMRITPNEVNVVLRVQPADTVSASPPDSVPAGGDASS